MGLPSVLSRSSHFGVLALALLVTSAGCIQGAEPSGGAADEPTATHAFFSVERSVSAGDAGGGRVQTSVRFLRTSEVGDLATMGPLVGATVLVPQAGCTSLDLAGRGVALRALSPVELVSGGEVSVSSDETRTHLMARAYPDVARLVSGVVYTSPGAASDLETDARRLTFHVAGSAELAPFEATFDIPEAPAEVRVNDVPLASVGDEALPRGPLTLRWRPTGDVVFVDVAPAEGGGASRFRCVARESDSLTLPPAVLPTRGHVLLGVHRVRVTQFEAPSLTSGRVQFDTAVVGRVSVTDGG